MGRRSCSVHTVLCDTLSVAALGMTVRNVDTGTELYQDSALPLSGRMNGQEREL